MDADLFTPKDIGPNSGEHILERRARSHEGLRRGDAAGKTQLRREPDAPHFAGCALRQLFKEQHLARNLEFGETLHGEPPDIFRCGLGVRPQHNGGGNVFA